MKHSPSRYTTIPKRDKIPHTHKNKTLLVHIVELSTVVVKVHIKATSASLTQNQCFRCVPPPLTHVEILRLRDVTELNNDGMIKFVDVHYQTDLNLLIFPKEI